MFDPTEEDFVKIQQHKNFVQEEKRLLKEKQKSSTVTTSQFSSKKQFSRKDFVEFLMPIIWDGGLTLKVSIISLAVLLLVS